MSWVWGFFTLGLFWEVSGLILPLTKQDGGVDMDSVKNHVALLDQMVTEFQKKTIQLEIDLQVTISDLQTTKSDLQTTKADLKDQQLRSVAEVTSLKDELAAVKGEVVMMSDELISAKSEVAALKTEFLSLQASMKQSVLDTISHDDKSNMTDSKSIKHALETTNSSLDTFIIVTTELHKQQTEVKSEISKLSSALSQIQSNVTFIVSDFHLVKDSVTVVQAQLNTTTSDINLIKSDVDSIRRNISDFEETSQSVTQISQILQSTTTELETTKSNLQDQERQSTSVHNSINNQLQTIKSDLALKTTRVAFRAWLYPASLNGHSSTLIKDHPVKFDIVEYNEGKGYDKTTGVFTAPVSGTYMFSAQVVLYDTSKPQTSNLEIMKSGSSMAAGYGKTSPPSIDGVTISITTVTYVKQGQEVWVRSDNTVEEHFSVADHFVGALVSAF